MAGGTDTAEPSTGGRAGDSAGNGSSSAGNGSSDEGGAFADGGTSSGAAGAPTTTVLCPEGYRPWLTSGFSFPDGEVLGTADVPSIPWIGTAGLEISAGRLSGLGTATVGQGVTFPYDGLRLRFRVRFTDSDQSVSVAFNGARNDVIGVYVTVDASGSLKVTEGDAVAGEVEVAPLASGEDWFVEAHFVGAAAEISLARDNYASERQSTVVAELDVEGLKANASGVKTLVELAGSGALAPSLDEMSVARCGVKPPAYEGLFLDTFERADSATLGNAELPDDAAWTASSSYARIVDGTLELTGLALAVAPLKTLPANGLRIRTTVRAEGESLWANISYNSTQNFDEAISSEPGFWLWGPQSDSTFTAMFPGAGTERQHMGKVIASGVDYFVELNRDDGSSVLTVRTGSFDGPMFVVRAASGLTAGQNTGQFLKLSTHGGIPRTRFEDIRVDRYFVE